MKTKLTLLVATFALAAGLLVPGATATTAPVIQVNIQVKVTPKGLVFSQKRAMRGWAAHFVIRNTLKTPTKVDIGGLVTPVIRPGGRAKVSASLEERGKFPYKVTLNAPKSSRGFFVVY
jgi:hypothetical protein